ncbi:MAG: DUF3267 domain-containing protein [Anaerolineales bacterium]|nr:DUF3267 domain-containing protein [Anaerolineales bacterium]
MSIISHNDPPGAIPAGYEQVLDWKITQSGKQILILNLISIPWLAVCAAAFMLWKTMWDTIREFTMPSSALSSTTGAMSRNFAVANWTLAILAGVAIMVILHELVHGLTMQRFGAKPKYGVLWSGLMFYATAAGFAFKRNQYLTVALSPLVVLSLLVLICLAFPLSASAATLLIVCGAFNAAGAIGDLWIVRIVTRYPAHAYVIDERDGVRIFMPEAS